MNTIKTITDNKTSFKFDLAGYDLATPKVTSPPFYYHGSKFRLAPWILSHMPHHRCYVEPYGGGAAVLLQKPRSYAEVYNDLDGHVVSFFKVLRDPAKTERLIELLQFTPYSRTEFEAAKHYPSEPDEIERVRQFLVRSYMGFGSANAAGHSGFATDTKRRYGIYTQYWGKVSERILPVIERFKGVIIENKDAVKLMPSHDGFDTLFYCDPPYMQVTRSQSRNKSYAFEVTENEHVALIELLNNLKGQVMLSGYDSDLYNDLLKGWQKHLKPSRISAGRGTTVRTECLWIKP